MPKKALVQLLLHHRRITCRHAIIWNVLYHHAACGYDATAADGYTWTDGDIATKPRVIADSYRMTRLGGFSSLHIIHRMLWGIEGAVGTNEHVVTYLDETLIEHRAVVVDKTMLADGDAAAMVAMEWGHDLG